MEERRGKEGDERRGVVAHLNPFLALKRGREPRSIKAQCREEGDAQERERERKREREGGRETERERERKKKLVREVVWKHFKPGVRGAARRRMRQVKKSVDIKGDMRFPEHMRILSPDLSWGGGVALGPPPPPPAKNANLVSIWR